MTSMTLPPPAVVGAQAPRLHSAPAYDTTAGGEAVALAARAGLNLDPWQQLVLRDALGETSDGRHSAFEVCAVVPRQNGKGSILEALELAALFLPDPDAPPPLILHSAHEFKTSAEHFRRMRDLIERDERLSKRVRIIRTAAGAESIELHSGARLRFVTRTGGSGRGFSADLIVVDEAYNLTAESMAAVLPTLSARPNPQVWYTSSAGMASSDQLARLRERGMRGGDPSLAYFEWSAEDDADLDDPRVWAQANPAFNIRIKETFVRAERAALPDEQFARERLGMWAATGPVSVIPLEVWAGLVERSPSVLPPAAFAVDIPPDRSSATVAVAVRTERGTRLEVAAQQPGTEWCVEWLTERARKHSVAVVIDPASPAGSLIDLLKAQRVAVRVVKARDYGQACGRFYDAVMSGRVQHLDDLRVERALRAAKTRTIGDAWAWARKDSTDISPLVAVTLALHGATVTGASTYEDRDPLVL